ncbi:MAG: DinB family protein [Anaerolineae bacterium]
MIPEFTQALFLRSLDEWGAMPERFQALPADEQAAFLKQQGYSSLHDLLAHAGVWWEEARGVIRDTLDHVERPRRRYDFDEFNAASMARFKQTPEDDFMRWYEEERQRLIALLKSLDADQMKIRRVYGWLDAVTLLHLKEHGIGAARFVALDMLQREWAGYIEQFYARSADEQKAFLEKQGFPRFRDLLAHIVAWWDRVLLVVNEVAKDPAYRPPSVDVDAYNAEAVEMFGRLDEADVWKRFEATRQALIELLMNLPDETYNHSRVQAWVRSDVIEHYFDHLN